MTVASAKWAVRPAGGQIAGGTREESGREDWENAVPAWSEREITAGFRGSAEFDSSPVLQGLEIA